MPMRSSSLANNPLAITREMDGRFDVVLQVRDNLDLIEQVAGIDFATILAELESAQDFTGITVVQGETVAWDAVNKILTVPKGDKGDKGDTGSTGLTGPQGIQGPQGIKGDAGPKGDTGSQGSKGFDGEDGAQGPKGDTGDDLTITQITYNGNGTFNWLFSDGTTYVTPDLRGPAGATGSQGVKGDTGTGVHHLKGTSTTQLEGDFGVAGETDTYTFYADAGETIPLGWFIVTNGVELSDVYTKAEVDALVDGISVDAYTKTEVQETLPAVGFDTTNTTPPTRVGQMKWNETEGTVDLAVYDAVIQIGQEFVVKVRNNSGTTITNGTVVMATGSIGNSGRITVASHDGTIANAVNILGVVTHNITNGNDGIVTILGKVRGINTTGSTVGETWTDGTKLYVKPNDGGSLTNVEPTDTETKISVAYVVNAHINGTLYVRVLGFDENHYKSWVQTKLDLKSNLISPSFTGTPLAPTATVGNNTTQIATTAFVNAEIQNDSTNLNTANLLVRRDASGNFSAGTITGALSGNAATATKLDTVRTINGSGFDGTSDITLQNNIVSYNGTAEMYIPMVFANSAGIKTIYQDFNGLLKYNFNTTTFYSPNFNGSLNGNSSTATKLATSVTIAGATFDGSTNIDISFSNLTDKPTTLAGYNISDAYTKTEIDTMVGDINAVLDLINGEVI